MFKDHFQELLLSVLFIFMVCVVMYVEYVKNDDTVNWAREQTGVILGALVMYVTRKITSSKISSNQIDKIEVGQNKEGDTE